LSGFFLILLFKLPWTAINYTFQKPARMKSNSWTEKLYDYVNNEEDARICKDIEESACQYTPKNYFLILLSNTFSKLGDTLSNPKTVLAWVMSYVNAPVYLISFIVPIRESGSMLPQIIIASYIRTKEKRKWVYVIGALLQFISMVAIGLVTLHATGSTAGWLIIVFLIAFTSLPGDEDLEFTIKVYPSHDGVTKELHQLKVGDHLLIGDAWGAIQYKGPGVFIAGGAGVTPFIAILKDLHRKGKLGGHRLFFANQKEKDIICRNKLKTWLGDEVVHILSKEDNGNFLHGHINRAFLEEHYLDNSGYVYLCGPPPMMDALPTEIYALGVPKDHLITEDPE